MDGGTAPCFPVGKAFGLALREEAFASAQHVRSWGCVGQGGEAPSDGTSLLLTTAQFPGVGTQAERVAMESADRICLSRAAHMKYKYLLGNGARATSEALGYF